MIKKIIRGVVIINIRIPKQSCKKPCPQFRELATFGYVALHKNIFNTKLCKILKIFLLHFKIGKRTHKIEKVSYIIPDSYIIGKSKPSFKPSPICYSIRFI